VISLAALVLLSPVMAAVALLVRAEDGGPAIFRQVRAGQHGEPFRLLKFRSMRPALGSVASLDRSHWREGVPDDFMFKLNTGDERNLTRIGATLRRSSLDELPQLVNVLRGHMSLVGPRPEILPIVECYNSTQRRRLAVKPGMTGWAQVNGRAESNHGAKITADLYWVDHASLGLYLRILARTVALTITARGAC
jgi:lipopolysaccharide/colanic/teichoic acid biosynthesis glycosyltransferase